MNRGWLHTVHPLLKIAGAILLIATAVIFAAPAPLGVLTLAAACLVLSTRAKRLWPVLGWVTLGLGLLGVVHWAIGGTTEEAVRTVLRLAVLIGVSSTLMLTTDPADLLRALRRVGLPPSLVLAAFLMWRSVPLLRRELEHVLLACRIEGLRLGPLAVLRNPGGIFRHVLLPMAFGMTGFADDLTLSLHTRGIGLDTKPGIAVAVVTSPTANALFGLLVLGSLAGAVAVRPW